MTPIKLAPLDCPTCKRRTDAQLMQGWIVESEAPALLCLACGGLWSLLLVDRGCQEVREWPGLDDDDEAKP